VGNTKYALALAGAALGGLIFAPDANAVLAISGTVGGIAVACQDQAACDTNNAVGQLSIGDQTLNGVQFIGSSQTQTVGPPTNKLDTSSFQIINNSGASVPISLTVSGTGFTAPTTIFSASGGGTFETAAGSNVNMSFFVDANDAQGAPGTPGTQVFTGSHTAVGLTDTFQLNSGTLPLVETGPFSMTLLANGTLVDGGSLVGRTQALVTDVTSVPVNEPGSLALLGGGLAAFGLYRNRRRFAPVDGAAA
jgi:hypothetical protein